MEKCPFTRPFIKLFRLGSIARPGKLRSRHVRVKNLGKTKEIFCVGFMNSTVKTNQEKRERERNDCRIKHGLLFQFTDW